MSNGLPYDPDYDDEGDDPRVREHRRRAQAVRQAARPHERTSARAGGMHYENAIAHADRAGEVSNDHSMTEHHLKLAESELAKGHKLRAKTIAAAPVGSAAAAATHTKAAERASDHAHAARGGNPAAHTAAAEAHTAAAAAHLGARNYEQAAYHNKQSMQHAAVAAQHASMQRSLALSPAQQQAAQVHRATQGAEQHRQRQVAASRAARPLVSSPLRGDAADRADARHAAPKTPLVVQQGKKGGKFVTSKSGKKRYI